MHRLDSQIQWLSYSSISRVHWINKSYRIPRKGALQSSISMFGRLILLACKSGLSPLSSKPQSWHPTNRTPTLGPKQQKKHAKPGRVSTPSGNSHVHSWQTPLRGCGWLAGGSRHLTFFILLFLRFLGSSGRISGVWPIRDNGVLTFWADDLAGAGRELVWFGSRGLGLVVLLLFWFGKGALPVWTRYLLHSVLCQNIP